jgi:3-methyladenine DNA glycosylase AlkD
MNNKIISVAEYLSPLRNVFEKKADTFTAAGAKAYMRHLSEFYGIKSPDRRIIVKSFLKENGLLPFELLPDLIYYCWEQPQREWQYFALELTSSYINPKGKEHGDLFIQLAVFMITHKSWWDCVDYISPNIVGVIFRKNPRMIEGYINSWMNSDNFWLKRTCVLFQLKYKKQTDYMRLFEICSGLSDEKEFFIRKAIGWALREYSKTDAEKITTYVNNQKLSNLSRKEAMRIIIRKPLSLPS